ncbi:S28 family serine protease [Chondromyces crocatus]|uniref:Tripeptidyl aminopeptidase n=1 Tax=Chondromyces crocatus TaxID=52 RepID=A0A0K1EL32_CHOCO|nr:S28 family serine protease [Chondromyces crocatus]AKT41569.1 tripeptidyl aminopeptidase [Chondromyces crocatus]
MRIYGRTIFTLVLSSLALVACGGDDDGNPNKSNEGGGGSCGTDCNAGGAGGAGGDGGDGGNGGGGAGPQADILERLSGLHGVEVVEATSSVDGYRYFELSILQPMDHGNPNGQAFQQRIQLHHRDDAAPTVLATTGYMLFGGQYLEEPTALLEANQLYVEHRYFDPSRPSPADWSLLNIEQAAADHHRIVELIRPLYSGAWISTGASKGGMTSVYHRRFYPDDVDGTVAYVAPLSFGLSDARYGEFLAQVGDDPACRQRLKDFQREVLLRRSVMLDRMADLVVQGYSFDTMGIEAAVEAAVIDLPFAFWQYSGASDCGDIPTAAASDDEIWQYLEAVGMVAFYDDSSVLSFEPYYWQAFTELGAPGTDESHIADLLTIDLDAIDSLPSIDAAPVFNPAAMQDIDTWVKGQGQRILFIYGETDPWTAGAFALGGAEDSYLFTARGANHYASISSLEDADRGVALTRLAAWAGVSTPQPLVHGAPRLVSPSPTTLRLFRRALSR